ncbi:MAG: hypothetical protein RIT45_1093 [Pseudomonadota bacterium]
MGRCAGTVALATGVLLVACGRPSERRVDAPPSAPTPMPVLAPPAAPTAAPGTFAPGDASPLPRRGRMQIVGRSAGPNFDVELAIDAAERTRGMMWRRTMADDSGMLFFMGQDHDWEFWMKNTYLPLDMVFLDAEFRVVGVLANVPPLTLDMRSCGTPSRYVLELAAHQAEKHGIRPGVQLSLQRDAP